MGVQQFPSKKMAAKLERQNKILGILIPIVIIVTAVYFVVMIGK